MGSGILAELVTKASWEPESDERVESEAKILVGVLETSETGIFVTVTVLGVSGSTASEVFWVMLGSSLVPDVAFSSA